MAAGKKKDSRAREIRRIRTLGILSAAAFLLASAFLWKHRIELFVLPTAWKEVLAMHSRGDAERRDARFRPNDFDRAVARVIGLQNPAYRPGSEYRMEKVRARNGLIIYFICYHNDPVARTEVLQPDGTPSSSYDSIHLLLDSRGRIIESALPVFSGHDTRVSEGVLREDSKDYDLLRVSVCRGGRPSPFSEIFSFDDLGWVPEGVVRDGSLRVPVSEAPGYPSEPDLEGISRFLASSRKGDLFRALYLIELSMPRSGQFALPLLSNFDPEVRARATAVLGDDKTQRDSMVPLLKDPDPLVRLAAADAIQGTKGWVKTIGELAGDPDREVALGAHRLLCMSSNLELARASFLELMVNRDESVLYQDPGRLATPPALEAWIQWLDEVFKDWKEGDSWETYLDDRLSALPEELLRSQVSRLVELYLRMEKMKGPREDLAAALSKIEDPRAESVVAGILSHLPNDGWDPQYRVLEALLHRPSKLESKESIEALESIAGRAPASGEDSVFLREESPMVASMVLARWKIPGAEERLLLQAREKGADFLGDPVWEQAPESLLESVKSISEDHFKRVQEIREMKDLERKAQEEWEENLKIRNEEEE